jgi:hypothetical protein
MNGDVPRLSATCGIALAARLRYVVDWRADGAVGARRRGGAPPPRVRTERDEGHGGRRSDRAQPDDLSGKLHGHFLLAAADLRDAPTAETEVFRRGEVGRPRVVAVSLQNV